MLRAASSSAAGDDGCSRAVSDDGVRLGEDIGCVVLVGRGEIVGGVWGCCGVAGRLFCSGAECRVANQTILGSLGSWPSGDRERLVK
jgi:hypothetical protein